MTNTTTTTEEITILPVLALDLFLNTELPLADILDATTEIEDIPNTFDAKLVK